VAILSEVLIRLFDATAESYKEPLGEVRRALHAGFTEGGTARACTMQASCSTHAAD